MAIIFERQNTELILVYRPEIAYTQDVMNKLNHGEDWIISHCFAVNKGHYRHDDPEENEIRFCIGKVHSLYTEIDHEVLGTTHTFYFSNDINLKKCHFVAYRNISILGKIDKVVDQDVYIGGSSEKGMLPFDVFESLIEKFPKSAELTHYAQARIATILKEYYPNAEQFERQFQRFLNRQDTALRDSVGSSSISPLQENARIEYQQFTSMRESLADLLLRSESVKEKTWQEQIHGLLRLLYPKYIAGIREVVIKGVDKHDKQPDFLMVDANGYIDILEIKKPDVQLLTKQSSYRNNYVPVKELSGAVQQIEKYIYCLNAWGKEGEAILQKQLFKKLPVTVTPKVVNPQGILLLGRSNSFNPQQQSDFELVKRQYKHIAEIMTYDDLLFRIDNIISALSHEIDTN